MWHISLEVSKAPSFFVEIGKFRRDSLESFKLMGNRLSKNFHFLSFLSLLFLMFL